jgi:hypothetical protein
MTTEPVPGTHFFCVDVETSGLRVWEEGSHLLTIGVVVVDEHGNVVDDFYRRMNVLLHPAWYNESMSSISETMTWWRGQSELAKQEAYLDPFRDRHDPATASRHLIEFVTQYGSDWTERLFVADPDKFDWVWTDWLISQSGSPDPFWYHAIDMWSYRHGVAAQKRTGKMKGRLNLSAKHKTHEAKVPHHALSDAFALAEDLCDFLEKQPIGLDQPSIEDYNEERVSEPENPEGATISEEGEE